MTFGETVANRRRELGLSQPDVAKALDVSVGCISKIEHNRIKPTSKAAKKYAALLQLRTDIGNVQPTGCKEADISMLEKRVINAIYELERVLDILHSMRGEINEESI